MEGGAAKNWWLTWSDQYHESDLRIEEDYTEMAGFAQQRAGRLPQPLERGSVIIA